MKGNRLILAAATLILLCAILGTWGWVRHFQATHTPILAPLRPLEVPDLSGAVIPLPFCDISLTQVRSAHSTGDENARTTDIEFIDGTLVWINSALGTGPSAAPYLLQGEFRDRFISSEKLTAYYYGLLSGKFAMPWRYRSLPDDAKQIRRVTPFTALAGSGLLVESDPDTASAFLWNPAKTRLATLTSSHGGASHLWEVIESWRWQERPEFPLEHPEAAKVDAGKQTR